MPRAPAKPRAKRGKNMTAEQVREVLEYCPTTGIFRWIGGRPRIHAGMIAGTINSNKYRYLTVNGIRCRASRLAWLYMHGSWPADQIDHINGRRDDDRIDNLREATNSQNNMNTPIYKNNSVGSRGVHWHKKSQKYRARIQINGKRIYLGQFDAVGDARIAYDHAAREYFGNFVRLA